MEKELKFSLVIMFLTDNFISSCSRNELGRFGVGGSVLDATQKIIFYIQFSVVGYQSFEIIFALTCFFLTAPDHRPLQALMKIRFMVSFV